MATAQPASLIQHLQGLAARAARHDTDRQLLDDFAARRDERAFTTLVERHGPMVLRVCRRVLRHEQDAEDACQATFLVLARHSGAIRRREALASWLYGVAYRTAMKARRGAARRRHHEARLRERTPPVAPGPTWDDVRAVLDEEIQHLPESFRSAFVLCILDGKTVPAAAAELGIKAGTLSWRLTRARQQLRQRLARRGIQLAALLAALSVAESAGRAGPPDALVRAAVRFGLLVAAGDPAAGVIPAHVAALAAGVTRAMFLTRAKIAVAVLLAVALVVTGAGVLAHRALAAGEQPSDSPKPEVSNQKPEPAAAKAPAADDQGSLAYGGRVLGPDGRPVAGARLFLLPSWAYIDRPAPSPEYATTGPDGRFRFRAPKSKFGNYQTSALAATASGHGVAWTDVDLRDQKDDLTLRLVPDDCPVAGQVVDLQGRPVPGVTARLLHVKAAEREDLRPWLEAVRGKQGLRLRLEGEHFPRQLMSPEVPGLPHKVVTDADGRFRLTGIGRDRLVTVRISGPTIATQELHGLTRPGRPIEVPESTFLDGKPVSVTTYYGATFRHVAAPARPITGIVRDRDTKRPLAGVTIKSYQLANSPVHGIDLIQTTTDAAGRYRLVGMPKGNGNKILLVPRDDQPYLTAQADVPDGPGFDPVTVDFDLKRGVWIEGKVTGRATGRPLLARVQYLVVADNPHIREHPGYEPTDTDPGWNVGKNGRYRVLGMPGPGVLAVQSSDPYLLAGERDDPDGAKEMSLFTIPGVSAVSCHAFARIDPPKDADTFHRDIALEPGQTYTGTVVGPDGTPLAGVQGSGLTGWAGWQEPVLETAWFTVRAFNPRRPRPVVFRHVQKGLVGVFEPPGDARKLVTVRLQPGASVTGRLVDAAGRPRAGVELDLSVRARAGAWWDGYSLPGKIKTGTDGRFRIDSLLPGDRFELHDPQSDFEFGDGLRSGKTKDLGDVRLKRPGE
jgi:RNA polymerase sigma factor (sigma-70 family)